MYESSSLSLPSILARLSIAFANKHGLHQALSFIVGYFLQDIKLAVYIALGGTALTFLAIIPPWPFFNQHPQKWLPIGGGSAAPAIPQTLVIDEKAVR